MIEPCGHPRLRSVARTAVGCRGRMRGGLACCLNSVMTTAAGAGYTGMIKCGWYPGGRGVT